MISEMKPVAFNVSGPAKCPLQARYQDNTGVISVPADQRPQSDPADDRRRLRVDDPVGLPAWPVDGVCGGVPAERDDTVSNGASASTGPISSDRR
jgi:hypothetical protein